ncbi:MAG: hypothetical protein ABI637_10695 [Gemmatimonadota bacterium]
MTLRPSDVVVAMQLVLSVERSYGPLSCSVGISLGESHNAVRRLVSARLASGLPVAIERENLIDFLVHGVPYAYPATIGAETWGVPTAPLPDASPFVWPSVTGKAWGRAITPLYSGASTRRGANPRLYGLLAFIDCIRIGNAAEQKWAAGLVRERLHPPTFRNRSRRARATSLDAA